MLVDHRNGQFFGGIEMQEYSLQKKQLIGNVHYLTEGSKLGLSEGPHLFQKDGYYYMILAEGGTEYNHALSIARSKSIFGPYEFHPENPVLTSKEANTHILQKAGHGDFVQTQLGEWYTVFIVGRPLSEKGRCILGRETAIEEIIWKNGWPYLKHDEKFPRAGIPKTDLKNYPITKLSVRDDFENAALGIQYQSLRIPISENWCSLNSRKGFLRLLGKESLTSTHNQSLIARRIQNINVEVSTKIQFYPKTFQQMAGLVFYYNTGHYHYACITSNHDGSKKYLSIFTADNYAQTSQEELVDITANTTIILKGTMKSDQLQFYYSLDDDEKYSKLGRLLDSSILSDDYVRDGSERYRPAFTGSFVGMCCQDLAYNRLHADFDWFEYKEIY